MSPEDLDYAYNKGREDERAAWERRLQPYKDEAAAHRAAYEALLKSVVDLSAFRPAPVMLMLPQRKPLTDADLLKLWGPRSDGPENREIISYARAVKRAHGIE